VLTLTGSGGADTLEDIEVNAGDLVTYQDEVPGVDGTGVDEDDVFTIDRYCERWLVLSWAVPGQPGHGHINCRPMRMCTTG